MGAVTTALASPSTRDATTLDAICRVLECQPGELLRWVPERPPAGGRGAFRLVRLWQAREAPDAMDAFAASAQRRR